MANNIDKNRIKRLVHRSGYRGFKEVDLILGGFAKAHAAELSAAEFTQFEDLLEEKDHDIYDWITGAKPTPDAFNTPLFAKVCAFIPSTVYGRGGRSCARRGEPQTQIPAGDAPPSASATLRHLSLERGREK